MPSSVPAAVALAVLVSLGAAMDASASATIRPAGSDAAALRPTDRRAVTAWLHRLADSTRKLHGQAPHADFAAPPSLDAAAATTLTDTSPATPRRHAVLALHRLIDLPPPVAPR